MKGSKAFKNASKRVPQWIPPIAGMRRTKTRIPTTPEELAATLHAKWVPKMSLDPIVGIENSGIYAVCGAHPLFPRFGHLLRYNIDASTAGPYGKVPVSLPSEHRTSTLPMEDFKTLEDCGQIGKSSIHEIKAVTKLFKHLEEKEADDGTIFLRNRVVGDPNHLNDHIPYEDDTKTMDLLSLQDQRSQVRPGDWAASGDFEVGYNQLALSDAVSNWHGIKAPDGSYWKQLVMTMGFGPNGATMDVLVKMLASTGMPEGVRYSTQIDQARFLHPDKAKVQLAMDNFRENVRRVGGKLKDEPNSNNPHQLGKWCGVMYDYLLGTTSLPPRAVTRLAEAVAMLNNDSMTVSDVFDAMGYFFFASAVLVAPLDKYYFPLKWYRRIAADFARGIASMTKRVNVWSCIRKDLCHWAAFLSKNTPAPVFRTGITPATLYTDASETGYGAVLFINGKVYVSGAAWTGTDVGTHINILEAEALSRALVRFKDVLVGSLLTIKIDNTSVIGAMDRGYSSSFAMNNKIGYLIGSLMLVGAYTIEYVASKSNLSDGESRRHQIDKRKRPLVVQA